MTSQYNIDSHRNSDGTYAYPSATWIKGMLRCGHTCHVTSPKGTLAIRPYSIDKVRINMRTGEPYFPGERAGENWLLEFYPVGGGREDETKLYTALRSEALEFAYKALTGQDHDWQAGQWTRWYANQNWRDADVLAVLGNEVLIEYVMPGTTNGRETSALVLCEVSGVTQLHHIRNYAHRALPKRWIRAMHDQGKTSWIGLGQREASEIPFPANEGQAQP